MKLFRFIGMLVIALMTLSVSASEVGLTSNFDQNDQPVVYDVASYDACDFAVVPSFAFDLEISDPIPISYNHSVTIEEFAIITADIITSSSPYDYDIERNKINSDATARYIGSPEYEKSRKKYIELYRLLHPYNSRKYIAKHETYKSDYLLSEHVLC